MSARSVVPPGDRYITQRPCGPRCYSNTPLASHGAGSATSSLEWIAVEPYSFVFRAPAKGRWLGRGLLELFIHEFAFVPYAGEQPSSDGMKEKVADTLEARRAMASTALPLSQSAVVSLLLEAPDTASPANEGVGGGGGATLDRRFTLPAYVEELCDGALWLHGREAECRAAGRRYRQALIHLAHARGAAAAGDAVMLTSSFEGAPLAHPQENATFAEAGRMSMSAFTSTSREVKAAEEQEAWEAWCRTVRWLARLPSESDVDALLPLLHRSADVPASSSCVAEAVVPLTLRQRDTVHHRVWRREGRMFAQPPIQVLRCDIAHALARCAHTASSPSRSSSLPALMVVSKPPGLPVHPSGCYRKNSVTSILEDVFGGCDGGELYEAVEHFEVSDSVNGVETRRPYASIVHRREGFELIRVFVRLPSLSSLTLATDGVSLEDWEILKQLVQRRRTSEDATSGSAHAGNADATQAQKRARDAESPSTRRSPEQVAEGVGGVAALVGDSPAVPAHYALKAFVVHRLDAATSGVLLFGLDGDAARRTALAIANKKRHDGEEQKKKKKGSTDVNREEESDDDDSQEETLRDVDGGSAASSSSQKVYYARVHGRVDLATLATTQHHCELRPPPLVPTLSASAPISADAVPAHQELALVVRRPIGCLDHHRSLYWCPDASLTELWVQRQQQQQHQREGDEAAAAAAQASQRGDRSASLNGKGTWSRTPEALAAKHERMRRLTRGSAGTMHLSPSASAAPASSPQAEKETEGTSTIQAEATQRVEQYLQTLRSATTVLSVDHYDEVLNQTVVRCTLGTGRTHQLRVHLASLGHPIVHDEKYVAVESFLRAIASPPTALQVGNVATSHMARGDSGEELIDAKPRAESCTSARAHRASDTPLLLFYSATSTQQRQSSSSEGNAAATGSGEVGAARIEAPLWRTSLFDDSRMARGCVCPDQICLHAWRYTLTYENYEERVVVEVPLPAWAILSA